LRGAAAFGRQPPAGCGGGGFNYNACFCCHHTHAGAAHQGVRERGKPGLGQGGVSFHNPYNQYRICVLHSIDIPCHSSKLRFRFDSHAFCQPIPSLFSSPPLPPFMPVTPISKGWLPPLTTLFCARASILHWHSYERRAPRCATYQCSFQPLPLHP